MQRYATRVGAAAGSASRAIATASAFVGPSSALAGGRGSGRTSLNPVANGVEPCMSRRSSILQKEVTSAREGEEEGRGGQCVGPGADFGMDDLFDGRVEEGLQVW